MNFFSCNQNQIFRTAPDNVSLLWEVRGKNLKKPCYVFGTMHLLCADQAKLSDNLKTIIKQTDAIYFEIDLDNLGELFSAAMSGNMRGDTSLKSLYSEAEYKRINDFFKQHNMGLQFTMFNKMQPMLVSALVDQTMLPCSNADGMEMSIMQEAHQYHKEINGLETAAFQVHLIDQIPYKIQAKELLNDIDSVETYKKQMDTLLNLYKQQDVEKLLKYSMKDEFGNDEMQDVLLNRRNANWAAQFEKISQNKSLLIAVGAAHLGGEKGFLNLLKQKGYAVRAITN